jgi:hypothetical protein
MIKRYLVWTAQGEIFESEEPDGEWVKYDDVAAQLAAPVAPRLDARVQEQAQAIREIASIANRALRKPYAAPQG